MDDKGNLYFMGKAPPHIIEELGKLEPAERPEVFDSEVLVHPKDHLLVELPESALPEVAKMTKNQRKALFKKLRDGGDSR